MTNRPPAKRKSAGVQRKQRRRPRGEQETSKKSPDEIIDEALDESFPASDPPSWSGRRALGLRSGSLGSAEASPVGSPWV
jgi:hypothetical protein